MDAETTIYHWHHKAQIDYKEQYLLLYISYNAWYRFVTRSQFDREAIARLKRRVRIWSEYIRGERLQELTPLVTMLSSMTTERPYEVTNGKWSGIINGAHDYENVIELWYQVRCSVFHGNITTDDRYEVFVRLAYQSLNIFMTEIVSRMNACITAHEEGVLTELEELNLPIHASNLVVLRDQLRRKYIRGNDPRSVDI